MCFSTEASFAASAVLGIIGYASIKATSSKSQLLLASIPCLFALQQFSEGIIWLNLRGVIESSIFTLGAQGVFLFFAYALWPLWIPFTILINEKHTTKKMFMIIIFLLGILAAYHNLNSIPPLKVIPKIVGHSIQYDTGAFLYNKVIYLGIVILPCLISSLRFMWLFALFSTISFIAAEYFYTMTFTSVWCFASAIISISLFIVIKSNQENSQILLSKNLRE